ncbi:MAG TPA: hypothetical protein VG755_41260 [Nannocystaceae bacterium]|nr:hypothetical protein [Nannocystaceae bacterium]
MIEQEQPRRGRTIGLTIAISALVAACVSGIDDEEADADFRDCDGAEEYIDENGEEVICIYTDEPGDGGGDGSDPCWQFPWLCYPGGDEGGDEWSGDGGGEAGGGGDGGGDDGGETCTQYGNDCTTAQRCCGSNVCAYGGERDTTWCQPLETSAWTGSCVTARTGAAVYRNGSVCRHINGQEFNSTCYSVQQQSCVIGYNGDCGNGTYTIQLRDLAQAEPGTCKG